MIYHSTSAQEAGYVTTEQEKTLVDEFNSRDEKKGEKYVTTYLFPEDSIIFDSEENKLSSKWSVLRTAVLHHRMEHYLMDRERKGMKVFKKEQNSFDMGIKLNILINLMNRVYGLHNWFTEIGDSKIIELVEEDGVISKLVIETTIRLTLADMTKVEKSGKGYSYGLGKEMSFRKCKKESVTEAMKLCISELILLLDDYEMKVKAGYYEKYR